MKTKSNLNDELLPEYDFRNGRRGRFAERFAAGTNLVLLEPDVAAAFSSSDAVNDALRRELRRSSSASSPGEFYVERRAAGDYAVRRGGSTRPSAITATQSEAITRARKMSPNAPILVERVRHTTGGSRDKWRKA